MVDEVYLQYSEKENGTIIYSTSSEKFVEVDREEDNLYNDKATINQNTFPIGAYILLLSSLYTHEKTTYKGLAPQMSLKTQTRTLI